jgi:luciferase family oxidoreductase group 1
VIPPLSILDLAIVERGGSVRASLDATVEFAQHAEGLGFRRVWYAEHHNMRAIASSATSVLIAHVAAHTASIRLGAGGIMLPNHAPLVIAEQFGTLAELHPGRIDLGLGRAPGSDQVTQRALRRDPTAADRFPHDVVELQGYLSDTSRVPGVEAVPGKGTAVPLYILGSSLFGASLAAVLGLPFAFASHFAPDALEQAIHLYRQQFEPSDQLDAPYVMAGINVVVSDDRADAEAQLLHAQRRRAARFVAPGQHLSDDEADAILQSRQGQQVQAMMRYTAAGDSAAVTRGLQDFAAHTGADELVVVFLSPTLPERLRSATLLAELGATESGTAGGPTPPFG